MIPLNLYLRLDLKIPVLRQMQREMNALTEFADVEPASVSAPAALIRADQEPAPRAATITYRRKRCSCPS